MAKLDEAVEAVPLDPCLGYAAIRHSVDADEVSRFVLLYCHGGAGLTLEEIQLNGGPTSSMPKAPARLASRPTISGVGTLAGGSSGLSAGWLAARTNRSKSP